MLLPTANKEQLKRRQGIHQTWRPSSTSVGQGSDELSFLVTQTTYGTERYQLIIRGELTFWIISTGSCRGEFFYLTSESSGEMVMLQQEQKPFNWMRDVVSIFCKDEELLVNTCMGMQITAEDFSKGPSITFSSVVRTIWWAKWSRCPHHRESPLDQIRIRSPLWLEKRYQRTRTSFPSS